MCNNNNNNNNNNINNNNNNNNNINNNVATVFFFSATIQRDIQLEIRQSLMNCGVLCRKCGKRKNENENNCNERNKEEGRDAEVLSRAAFRSKCRKREPVNEEEEEEVERKGKGVKRSRSLNLEIAARRDERTKTVSKMAEEERPVIVSAGYHSNKVASGYHGNEAKKEKTEEAEIRRRDDRFRRTNSTKSGKKEEDTPMSLAGTSRIAVRTT